MLGSLVFFFFGGDVLSRYFSSRLLHTRYFTLKISLYYKLRKENNSSDFRDDGFHFFFPMELKSIT